MTDDKNYFGFDSNFNLKKIQKEKHLNRKTDNFVLAKYVNIGYYLVTPIIFGVILGYLIDQRTNNKVYAGFGLLIGTVGTFYNLIRLYIDERKNSRSKSS